MEERFGGILELGFEIEKINGRFLIKKTRPKRWYMVLALGGVSGFGLLFSFFLVYIFSMRETWG